MLDLWRSKRRLPKCRENSVLRPCYGGGEKSGRKCRYGNSAVGWDHARPLRPRPSRQGIAGLDAGRPAVMPARMERSLDQYGIATHFPPGVLYLRKDSCHGHDHGADRHAEELTSVTDAIRFKPSMCFRFDVATIATSHWLRIANGNPQRAPAATVRDHERAEPKKAPPPACRASPRAQPNRTTGLDASRLGAISSARRSHASSLRTEPGDLVAQLPGFGARLAEFFGEPVPFG